MPEDVSNASKAPEHLHELYRLAQALMKDPEQAERLTAATYHRAATVGIAPEDRLGLFRLLIERHDAGIPFLHLPEPPTALSDPPPGFQQRATAHLLDRVLPAVFATLSAEIRLLLVLDGVEGCSSGDIGRIIGLSPGEACRQLDRARTTLRQRLVHNARPAEQALLDDVTDAALQAGLRRLIDTAFAAPPLTLRTAAGAAQHPAPPATPTPERSHATHSTAHRPFQRLRHALFTLLIIGVAGATGYFAHRLLEAPPATNVLTLSVRQPPAPRLTFQTNDHTDAERFVRDQLERRLSVPTVEQATLQDVSIIELAAGVYVPVFHYKDLATGAPLTVYAYSYTLLSTHKEQLRLNPDILRTIAEARKTETRRVDRRAVLVWRHRDDIFVAVSAGDPDALRERLF